MTILQIDSDLFCYRCAASAENDDVEIAKQRLDALLDEVINRLQGDSFQFFLSGNHNFRYDIYPEYKATRIKLPKPRHLKALREYAIQTYAARVSDGCEADDLMGIAQCMLDKSGSIIVSLDKDMLMVPGMHYSWAIDGGPPEKRWHKDEKFQLVEPLQGLRTFYTQLLVGDPSDNIKGAPGIGKVIASRLLSNEYYTDDEMFDIVRDAYGCDAAMEMNAKVLWIWQEPNGIWQWPKDKEKYE